MQFNIDIHNEHQNEIDKDLCDMTKSMPMDIIRYLSERLVGESDPVLDDLESKLNTEIYIE